MMLLYESCGCSFFTLSKGEEKSRWSCFNCYLCSEADFSCHLLGILPTSYLLNNKEREAARKDCGTGGASSQRRVSCSSETQLELISEGGTVWPPFGKQKQNVH